MQNELNPRAFIDMNGGYQTVRAGLDKEAHDAWVKTNTWGLTRDDFIRLSYFHGCIENGSDGSGPINGSEDRPGDVVYVDPSKGSMTRAMVSHWISNYDAFVHGYIKAARRQHGSADRSHVQSIVRDVAELDYSGESRDLMQVSPEDLALIVERHTVGYRQHGSAPDFESAWAAEIAANGGTEIGADYKHWMLKGWNAKGQHGSAAQAVGAVEESSGEHDTRVVLTRDLPVGAKLYTAPPVADAELRTVAQMLLDRYDQMRGAKKSAPEMELLRAALSRKAEQPNTHEGRLALIREHGDAKLIEAVRHGETSIAAAVAKVRAEQPAEAQDLPPLLSRIQGALDLLADAKLPMPTWRDVSNVLHACRDAIAAHLRAAGQGGDGDLLDRQREIGAAVARACAELPEGFDLHIELERNAGSVILYLPDTDASESEFESDTFAGKINKAINYAIAVDEAKAEEQQG